MSASLRTRWRLPGRLVARITVGCKRLLTPLMAPFSSIPSLKSVARDLTFNQKIYFISALALFITALSGGYAGEEGAAPSNEFHVGFGSLVGLFAGIAVCRELWQIFQKIWSSVIGKAVILVVYAGTANFALAVAGQKVNHVAGIEPGPLIFTTGFTALLMLPFWIIGSTLVFSSLALLATNLWFVICLLLRIVRVKVRAHWEETRFVLVTLLARIILIPVFTGSLVQFIEPYSDEITIFQGVIASLEVNEEQAFLVVNNSTEHSIPINQVITHDLRASIVAEANGSLADDRVETVDLGIDSSPQWTKIDTLIAYFIYFFETYPSSACQKAAEERVLPIGSLNEESMLSATLAPGSELGVIFAIKPCNPYHGSRDVGTSSNQDEPPRHEVEIDQ